MSLQKYETALEQIRKEEEEERSWARLRSFSAFQFVAPNKESARLGSWLQQGRWKWGPRRQGGSHVRNRDR